MDFSKVKKVYISVRDDESHLEPLVTTTTTTKSKSQTFADRCLMESKQYKKPFRYLKYYQRRARVRERTHKIIGCCVTSKKDLKKGGFDYIQKNRELAVDAISLLDELKLDICRHLCLNYREIENFMSPPQPEEEASSENFELDMAISLLGEVTQGGYNRLRDKLVKNKLTDVKKFPSFYTLTKSRLKIESLNIIPLPTDFDEIDKTDEGIVFFCVVLKFYIY